MFAELGCRPQTGLMAESIWNHDRDAANRLGIRWSGATSVGHPNVFDWRTQASALRALIGNVRP